MTPAARDTSSAIRGIGSVIVERTVLALPLTRRVLERLGGSVPVTVVDDTRAAIELAEAKEGDGTYGTYGTDGTDASRGERQDTVDYRSAEEQGVGESRQTAEGQGVVESRQSGESWRMVEGQNTTEDPEGPQRPGTDGLRGGRPLVLCDFHGEAIKPCPGTPRYLCCGYQILNFGQGCPFDCSYCILQGYLEHRHLVVQANADALLAAASERLRAEPQRFFRLGTGEFADSLALEPLTGWAERLVAFAREQPNAVLELKTKSDRIDGLLGLDHGGRTVCAWSLNAADVAAEEEHGVAPLEARLAAAARCAQAGYRLAFHFDPIFHYDGWAEGYRRTVERLFASVPAERIAWISLGCFRFTAGLDRVIARRFPRNRRIYGEFVRGEDGKMRYPQPLRVAIYRRMAEWIAQAGGGNPLVYLCMENAAVWRAALGCAPHDNEELGAWLDAACRR